MLGTGGRLPTYRFITQKSAMIAAWFVVEGVRPLEAFRAGTGARACAAGPTKATGCANADGDVMAGTGALLTGALWRPTE
jgi:hypothetical protein